MQTDKKKPRRTQEKTVGKTISEKGKKKLNQKPQQTTKNL